MTHKSWIVGLLSTAAVLLGFCVGHHAPRIERQLEAEARGRLAEAILPWARVVIDGRNLVVSGEAPSRRAETIALDLLSGVEGLRKLDNGLTVTARSYDADFHYDGTRLTLRGWVPDESTRSALATTAETRFGAEHVEESLELMGAAPANWIDAARLALFGLVRLDQGSASLADERLIVSGQGTPGATSALLTDLDARLPANFTSELVIDEGSELDLESCRTEIRALMERDSIRFRSDSAEIASESFPLLHRLSRTLHRCPRSRIEVAALVDSTAPSDLAGRGRAEAVVGYLSAQGVDPSRLSAIGPVAANVTPTTRSPKIELRIRPGG